MSCGVGFPPPGLFVLKSSRTDLVQDRGDMCRDRCSGGLQQGRDIGFNSRSSKEKWEFLIKDRVGVGEGQG